MTNKTWLKNAIRVAALLWPGLAVLGLIVVQLQPCWNVTPDTSVYIELGRNLASGRGYFFNGEPFYGYPPVFPGMLAAAIALFGDSYLVMRAVVTLSAIAFLAVSWLLMRRLVGWRAAMLLLWLYGLGWIFLEHVQYILSDLPGALFAVLALLALMRFERTDHRRGRFGAPTLLATGAVLLAVATRLANLAIAPAIILYFFIFRRDRFSRTTLRTVLPMLLLALGAAVAWNVARRTSGSSYHGHPIMVLLGDPWDWDAGYLSFLGVIERTVLNLHRGLVWVAVILIHPTRTVAVWLRWLSASLFLLGLVVSLIRRRGLVEAFTLCGLLLPLVTPFVYSGGRYYLVLGPFLFYYAYEGVRWLVELAGRLSDRQRRTVSYAVGALLLLPVVLMAVGVGPLGPARAWFGSPVRVAFAVAFAVSMLVGLLGDGRLSFRRLFLPVAATVLLIVWATVGMGISVPEISKLRKAQRGHSILYDPDVLATVDRLKELARPGDACVSSVPSLYRGLSGLRSYWFPFRQNLETVREGFFHGDWVLLDLRRAPDVHFGEPAIKEKPEQFELVAKSGPVRLYRVVRPADDSTSAAPAPVED
jgi:branched-subunit amino acid transport protein AzlD